MTFVIEMAELTGDKMSICVCVHSQAAIWLTAEIWAEACPLSNAGNLEVNFCSFINSLVLNDIYGGSIEGMEKEDCLSEDLSCFCFLSPFLSERPSSSEAPFWRLEIFILHANVALSIKHCVQRKIKKKKEKKGGMSGYWWMKSLIFDTFWSIQTFIKSER